MNTIHELKVYKEYFDVVELGLKTFEVRKDDRNYQVGDTLILNEYDEKTGYSGRKICVIVTYALRNPKYCKENFVILGFKKL